MKKLNVYSAPKEAIKNEDFSIRVRLKNMEWQSLYVYKVKVDMHNVREASMAYFDMEKEIEVEITCNTQKVEQVKIRPLSHNLPFEQTKNKVYFTLKKPCKLSIEINNDRFHNLHLFANPIETDSPVPGDENVLVIKPGIHRTEDILRLVNEPDVNGNVPEIIYFSPGMHYLEETVLRIPSEKTVYLAGGSVVVGSMVCESVENVSICGRGVLYLANFERFTSFRGVRIVFSRKISVEGIIVIDPPHYSIFIGQSENVQINNFKSFSTRGWSDGIDIMSSSNIEINDVFMRNSDDCIAVYGSRWDFYGDTKNISVKNSILWADVAHPINIGTHGDYEGNGDVIEDVLIENIDILEHHEFQSEYLGALSINPGDKNLVRNITIKNIRIEPFEHGRVFDIRVKFNRDYNPAPGSGIESILLEDIYISTGTGEEPSLVAGYDDNRIVKNVTFRNIYRNQNKITSFKDANIKVGDFVKNIVIE